jgi:hypothetical protein
MRHRRYPAGITLLKKLARVVSPTGKQWTQANIGNALAGREIARHLRELGTNTRGPAALTKKDRSRFLSALDTGSASCNTRPCPQLIYRLYPGSRPASRALTRTVVARPAQAPYIEFDFVQPVGAVRCLLNELGKLRLDPGWRRGRSNPSESRNRVCRVRASGFRRSSTVCWCAMSRASTVASIRVSTHDQYG